MTASWHPFSVHFEEVIAALEEHVRNGVEQPDQHRFVFQSALTAYALPRPAYAITEVRGTMQQSRHRLRTRRRFQLREQPDHLVGAAGTTPGRGQWRRRPVHLPRPSVRPDGFQRRQRHQHPGARGRARADGALRADGRGLPPHVHSFATGVALDNVVALLGVKRIPAQKATGKVTFARRTTTNRAAPLTRHASPDLTGHRFVTSSGFDRRGRRRGRRNKGRPARSRRQRRLGAITVMPTRPPGVNSVTMPRQPAAAQADPNEQLRQRARPR